MTVHIIQHGIDGFGHQLYGLFTTLILHNINKYYFDGYVFINKQIIFQHISGIEAEKAKEYLIECVKEFIKYTKIIPISYNNIIHSHELYNIPMNYDINTIYSIDNAYYFDRLILSENGKNTHIENINIYKQFFINSKLPKSRLNINNIVIHVRIGDAATTGRGEQIKQYLLDLDKLLYIFTTKYSDYTIYIHSDGDISFLQKKYKFILYEKYEPILNVLSDFIYSTIFVCPNSGLSEVASFLGNKELIIIDDSITVSMPDKSIRMSEYISNNY